MVDFKIRFSIVALVCVIANFGFCQNKCYDIKKLDSEDFKNLLKKKSVLIVGEIHGTCEVPNLTLQLAKKMSGNDSKLTIALEINKNYQKDIDEYLKTGDFDKLISIEYFRFKDGRTSIAMGQLIKKLKRLRNIKIVCFDVNSNSAIEINRDSLMAINLIEHLIYGKLLVLTGNIHANLKEGFWKKDFKSATYYLSQVVNKNQLVTLNTYFGGGTVWNCIDNQCKEREAYINLGIKEKYGFKNFICFYDTVHNSGYNGFIYFDKVTASKPLIEN